MAIKNLRIWWPKANCKWPWMQRFKCPIHNGTVYTVVSSTEICVCKHIENRFYSKIFRCALCISWTQNICSKMPLIVKKCSQFKQTFLNSTNTIAPNWKIKCPQLKKKIWNFTNTFAPNCSNCKKMSQLKKFKMSLTRLPPIAPNWKTKCLQLKKTFH